MTGYNYVVVWFSFFFFPRRTPLESRYELFLAIVFTCTPSVAYKERFHFGLAYDRVLYVLLQSSDYLIVLLYLYRARNKVTQLSIPTHAQLQCH